MDSIRPVVKSRPHSQSLAAAGRSIAVVSVLKYIKQKILNTLFTITTLFKATS